MALEKTIYIGPFVHSESLTELDICPNGMIGVDEAGKIAFIRRDIKGRQLPVEEDWEKAKVVRTQDYGFFFPGFIGLVDHICNKALWTLKLDRHAYARLSISQCRCLRQINIAGLA